MFFIPLILATLSACLILKAFFPRIDFLLILIGISAALSFYFIPFFWAVGVWAAILGIFFYLSYYFNTVK